MDYIKEYKKWLNKSDSNTVSELMKMNDSEKQDAFYRCLEFGTGGLRGVMGAGTNRMNIYSSSSDTRGCYCCQNYSYNRDGSKNCGRLWSGSCRCIDRI